MKTMKQTAALLLCMALLLTAIPMVSADGSFTGVKDWFQPSLREMEQLNLLPDSFYGMDLSQDITRGEMCELAVHALETIVGYEIEPERYDYFTDTGAQYIIKAYELGIVSGYPSSGILPDHREFLQCRRLPAHG